MPGRGRAGGRDDPGAGGVVGVGLAQLPFGWCGVVGPTASLWQPCRQVRVVVATTSLGLELLGLDWLTGRGGQAPTPGQPVAVNGRLVVARASYGRPDAVDDLVRLVLGDLDELVFQIAALG